MELRRFQISDSNLEHNDWKFPENIKSRPLRALEDEDFFTNHKIDRSYDDSTVKFKLLVTSKPAESASNDTPFLPFRGEVAEVLKHQKWTSDEWEHMWFRDGGGSAALTSHGILTFILQTPRDGHSFCSLSLVNRERSLCSGVYVPDEHFGLQNLLASQTYMNRHPKVPRDFAILPFNILVRHISETLSQVARLSRELTSTEKRISNGDISLEDNGDYKLLNRLNLEHLRLQRRSKFEIELGDNLLKYLDEYHRMWLPLWEGGTGYIEDMREKIEQQLRYSDQVKLDLEVMPRRIKNQSKAIFNFIQQKDNRLNIQLAESSRKIAEESRRDNLLNIEIAKQTAQVAEATRRDSAAMKAIAILTLVFLPGTAIASFFSMNMFNWDTGDSVVSGYLWVYFAVTVPITGFFVGFYIWWMSFSQKRYKKRHQAGLRDIEKGLKDRLKSATFSW